MAEQMLFPDTWEEFEDHYGFYDIKQAYTFGNTRLIPSFRVQQWLDHIADIERKKQSQKNKMEQVAKLFGKKLYENFKMQVGDAVFVAKITDHGLVVNDCLYHYWAPMLTDLLISEAVIIDE